MEVLSPYPLGTRTPQPPAAALLARWRGGLAFLGPDNGCRCSQRGSDDACLLQQEVGRRRLDDGGNLVDL